MKEIDYRRLCHPAHPEFRLTKSPFYLMAHVDFDYHEDMSTVLEKHGVNRSIYRIMTVLREHESANIGVLAERSLTKRNTASRIVERMVAKELVQAYPNPTDSRVTEVALTKQGRDLLNSLTPIVGRQFQRAIDGLNNEDLEHLVLVLQKMSGNLSRLPIESPDEMPPERRIGIARLPPGQCWTAGTTAAGTTAVARVEVAQARGHGIRLLNESPSAALRAGVKAAKGYLHMHAADLVGTRNPRGRELTIQVHPLNGRKVAGSFGLGLLLALCSSVLNKQLRGGLVVVGELADNSIKSVQQPTELIDAAVREGARAVLMPVSCRRALADVSDEIATTIEMLFYASVPEALSKAVEN